MNKHYPSLGPLPTTRKARYALRRKRYIRRRARANRNRRRVERRIGGVPIFRRATDWTLVGDGSLQRPPGLHPDRGHGYGWAQGNFPHWSYLVTAARQHVLPVVRLYFDLHPYVEGTSHQPHAHAGYAARRVKYHGHKLLPKTTGRRKPRAIKYATRFFSQNGWYPAWDPLHRHPNETDP